MKTGSSKDDSVKHKLLQRSNSIRVGQAIENALKKERSVSQIDDDKDSLLNETQEKFEEERKQKSVFDDLNSQLIKN